MTLTTALPVQADKDPQALVDPETFDKLAEFFAARQEVTKIYARRAVGQMLLMLKAHADSQHDPDFGRLLPDGRSYRVVPTEPVDAAWHASLQHTEAYAAACEQIGGGFVHHVPILTEGMADGSSLEYTRQALKATGYYIDPAFWDGEAKSCCPPNPGI
ncbi:hypothetical protein [Actinoplanes teichomyceticus]|uniref:Uncharacterized protein n=1 Tax=Actinoplanes teichomyceticus TaxID=1867 RepID=A0A561VQ21_ACTTI|nr:hypothetical protein [Actinoplanes teichomyceticus]TWG13724.1 hypothetical protein FHX34_10411 [Actinoplanes teichomyceticus]GIF12451.1 hypothetical protein Ate01nite_24830 [Actinoplanes teichomyceticus]